MTTLPPASATADVPAGPRDVRLIRWLTYLMFLMFAMTTDSVGVIIPEVIREFNLSLTQASAFHYATMAAIACSGMLLGGLADRLGHKRAILLGLLLFTISSYLFLAGAQFGFFLGLLVASGVAIGVFKTGALALIGDISHSTRHHTATMNAVEGFFGVGAIIGPAVVAALLAQGLSWKGLYVIAGTLSLLLLVVAAWVRYPVRHQPTAHAPVRWGDSLALMRHPQAMAFAIGLSLYVAVECAIYVWMPTLFRDYPGGNTFLATYALAIFFVLRAAGRFLGAWVLARYDWSRVLLVFSLGILGCFAVSTWAGPRWAVILLPLSGLFMSVIYPTLNSKGISCVPKHLHGSAAGLNLFFSCLAAAGGPLAMGAVGDAFGGARDAFVLATGFAGLLFLGLVYNAWRQPARQVLAARDRDDYAAAQS